MLVFTADNLSNRIFTKKTMIMNLTNYLQLPISERKQIVIEPVGIKDPFWLERLKTAVETLNPFAVMFSQKLINEYWTLKRS